MQIVGLDLSLTATGICILDSATLEFSSKSICVKSRGVQRLYEIQTELLDIIFDLSPPLVSSNCIVFIEDYAFAARGRVFDLGELGGVIRYTLYEKIRLPYYEVPPTTLKKFVTGKGNSPKNIMLEQVFRKFNVGSEILKDDNQVDAYALCRFGKSYLEWKDGGKKFTKNEIESFLKLSGAQEPRC